MTVLGGLIYVLAPKYFVAQQAERDNSTKCKSYRALESIALLCTEKTLTVLSGYQRQEKQKLDANSTNAHSLSWLNRKYAEMDRKR